MMSRLAGSLPHAFTTSPLLLVRRRLLTELGCLLAELGRLTLRWLALRRVEAREVVA
jgi:hypothetical protein